MKKILQIFFLSAIIMCMLAMPAMANYNSDGWPVETRVNGTVNGGVFHDSIGWTESTTQTLETDVPNGTVKYAYLYTGVWGNGVSNNGWVNVSFNGDSTSNKLGPIHLEGENDINDNVWCTGLGKYWFWYNVTNLVNAGQINTAITSEINGTLDGRVYGIMLVVVYEGGDEPKQIQYWINDGSEPLSSTNPTGTTNFVGTVSTDNDAMANLTMVHLTGYKPICSDCMQFNGNGLDTSYINTNFFDMHTWNVTKYVQASGNNASFSQGSDPSVNICNAILTVENAPDLNVIDVLVNPGNTRYEDIVRVYVNQSNSISAVVENNGSVDVTDNFDVCFKADGVKIGCATVTGGLSAGANITVSIDWTPTYVDYPVMPGFPTQSLPLTINVTVDCNCSNCPICPDGSCGTITETDETNNTLSKFIPAMQVYNTYNVIGGVVNNGYKSKNFDSNTTEEPLDQFKYYNLIGGGVEYNVSGTKISSFAPDATDTRVHHIDLPSGMTVKDARLYVYWQDKWGNYETYSTGCLANLSVNFNGTDLMPDAAYQDSKAFGFYQSPKGSSVFNVTSLMTGSGDYTAIVKNIEPIAGNGTTLLGEMLVVVYEGADHGNDVQIWMLEGTDYLMAADDTHNSYDFSVSPEEATATVSFDRSINLEDVDTARLITVVAQGMSTGSDLLFNGDVIKTDAWGTSPSSEINVENVSVKSELLASGNNMGFRDNGTNGMQASNAILIVKETTSLPTAPMINSVTLNTTEPNTGDDILVTVNATDDVEVTAVTANGEALSNDGGDDIWVGTIIAINGTHNVNISASDAAGNIVFDETANYTATTPVTTLPVVLVEDVTIAPNGYAFTSIMVENVTDLGSGIVSVTFDPSVVQAIEVTSGDGNALTVQDWNVNNTAGSVEISSLDAVESHNGDVVFALVTFHSIGYHLSSTPLAISSAELSNYDTYEPITHSVATGTLDTIAPIVIIDNVKAASGEFTTARVMVNNASNLGSGIITVTYNSSVVHVTDVTSGDGNALALQDWNVDNSTGSVQIIAQDGTTSHNGDVVLAIVTFHAVGEYPDSTQLAISFSELIDYTSYGVIGHRVTNGTFSIIDNEPPVITDAIATPDVILNDNGRPRVPGTNVTVLNATVIDNGSGVANVTINLSSIGGSDNQVMERIAGTDVWTVATTATDGINLTHELVVTATDGEDNTNTSVIGLTVLLRGDVVRDGDLNSADALYIAKYLVGKEPMPSLLVSDMFPAEGDGKINSADALYLAKYLVGKEAAP